MVVRKEELIEVVVVQMIRGLLQIQVLVPKLVKVEVFGLKIQVALPEVEKVKQTIAGQAVRVVQVLNRVEVFGLMEDLLQKTKPINTKMLLIIGRM
jgi:hypothetical protein